MATKTQAQLDAAVIEAAVSLAERSGSWTTNALIDAVRARREAMRPHKAAVLRTVVIGNHGAFGNPDKDWNDLPYAAKLAWRDLLARVLAAPDEPEGGE